MLDSLKDVDMVVFDKTGTHTEGVFEVTTIAPAPGVSEDDLLKAAGIAEMESNHPVARSIMNRLGRIERPGEFAVEELPGRGMKAEADGGVYLAGNARLMEEMGIQYVENASVQGTVVYVAKSGKFLGSIMVSDRLRAESAEAVAELKNRGFKTYMLTGDRPEGAAWVAEAVGVDEYKAGLLPSQKVDALDEITKPGGPGHAIFVGDGVNDAPILSLAGIGVAWGGAGSEVAVEGSQVVLQNRSPAQGGQSFVLA